MKDIKRILFINLDRIGDIIRSTFLFRVIKQTYPESYVACITLPPGDEILKNDPHIDAVIPLGHQLVRDSMREDKTMLHLCFPVFKFLEELRLHHFDLVINPFSEFGAMAVRYIQPRYVLGRAMDKSGNFLVQGKETAEFVYFMENVKRMRSHGRYQFNELYAHIFRDLNIEIKREQMAPQLYISHKDICFAEEFLEEQGVKKNDLIIGFQVGAFTEKKMWPITNFAKLADALQEDYDAKIIVNGSPHEAQTLCQTMLRHMKHAPIIAAGKTTVSEACGLISMCDLFIANDTGPMHAAAAIGIPIVALFGARSSNPFESKPWGDGHRLLVKEYLPDITFDEVYEATKQMITDLPK